MTVDGSRKPILNRISTQAGLGFVVEIRNMSFRSLLEDGLVEAFGEVMERAGFGEEKGSGLIVY
jgi:hypothetical protein